MHEKPRPGFGLLAEYLREGRANDDGTTYKGQIFIAEHGSWNRKKKVGYRVALVRLKDGKAVSDEAFAQGWL